MSFCALIKSTIYNIYIHDILYVKPHFLLFIGSSSLYSSPSLLPLSNGKVNTYIFITCFSMYTSSVGSNRLTAESHRRSRKFKSIKIQTHIITSGSLVIDSNWGADHWTHHNDRVGVCLHWQKIATEFLSTTPVTLTSPMIANPQLLYPP